MIQMLMYSNRIQEALSLSLEIKAFFEREYIDKTLVDSDYEFLLLMLCEIYQVSNRLKEQKMFYCTKLFDIKSQIYNLQDDIEKENKFKGYVQFLSSLFEMKGLADIQPQEEMNYCCFSAYYS